MRKLNEQEILSWIRTPGNRSYKYRINAQGLGFLSLFGAGLLAVALLIWMRSDWDRDMVIAAIIVMVTLNLFIWVRVAMSMWFVARHVVGISPTELLLVKGHQGVLIPLQMLHSSNIGWNEGDVKGMITSLPIRFQGETFDIHLVGIYYSLDQFPAFLGAMLEHVSDNALAPKDTI